MSPKLPPAQATISPPDRDRFTLGALQGRPERHLGPQDEVPVPGGCLDAAAKAAGVDLGGWLDARLRTTSAARAPGATYGWQLAPVSIAT